jgi:RNA polymerase sigma factor (sigma-70 family)
MPPPAEGFAARFVVGPALRTQPDRRLVTLVREGYENAFEEIVRRYGKTLIRCAAAIVGGRAEDVTQDAFSKALLALRRDGGNEIELRPWLFRIVRNTALNDLRDSPPSAEMLAQAIASGDSPTEELERREELADLMRRLRSLPEAQRAAIVMRELEGLGHDEIASALGLSDGGARQAIYRARRSLRDGAGLLLPLPLLKALLAGAASAPVEVATGAAGVGGAAGAGVALKAAAATVLVAGAVGAGVAIDHNRHPHHPAQPAASRVVAGDLVTPRGATPAGHALQTGGQRSSAESGRGAEREPGNDHGDQDRSGEAIDRHGNGGGDSGSQGGPRSSGDDGNRGPGGGDGQTELGDDGGGGPSSAGHGGVEGGGGSGDNSSGSGSGSSSGSRSASSDEGRGSVSDGGSGLNSGSGSGGGDGTSGGGGGDDLSNSESSGDSHGGDGLSVQMQPPIQEEP